MRKEQITVYCDFCGKEIVQDQFGDVPHILFCGRIITEEIELCDNCYIDLLNYIDEKKESGEE